MAENGVGPRHGAEPFFSFETREIRGVTFVHPLYTPRTPPESCFAGFAADLHWMVRKVTGRVSSARGGYLVGAQREAGAGVMCMAPVRRPRATATQIVSGGV